MLHTNQKIIKHKVGLLNLAEELGNVSRACKTMGLSRDTFYRYKAAVEEGGVEALLEQNRRKPNLKNRVDPAIEQTVVDYAIEAPMVKHGRATSCVNEASLFLLVGCAVFGCVITLKALRNA